VDVINLIVLSARIYASRLFNYLYASIAYVMATIVACGVAVAFLLLDAGIALLAGNGGAWIYNPIFAFAILMSTLLGIFCFFYIYFAAAGAYMHLCAQIGSGQKDAGISQYTEYMVANANSFFSISAAPGFISFFIIGVLALAGILISKISFTAMWILFAIASTVWFFVQIPVWFAYAAKVVSGAGAFDSIKMSVYIIMKNPLAALAIIFMTYVLAIIPTMSIIFYPIYFFTFLSPFSSILTIGFYEVSQGLIKPKKK